MTYDDVKQIQHNLRLHLDGVKLASPARDIARVESQLHLIHQIMATYRCSTPTILQEIMAHPEAATVATMIEMESRQREARESRERLEAEIDATLSGVRAITATLRMVK